MDPEFAKLAGETLDSAMETIESLSKSLAQSEQARQELISKQAEHEKVVLQKVAASKQVFDETELNHVITKLANLSIIPEGYQSKVANQLRQNPASALAFIDRVTDALVGAPQEGFGVAKEAQDQLSSDPDGWNDYITGRNVGRK